MSTDPAPGLVPASAMLTIGEAAVLTGLSTDTVKNDRTAGCYPHARQDAPRGKKPGVWRIPVTDLVAAGRVSAARLEQLPAEIDSLRESSTVTALRAEIAELTTRLAVADALALERDHARRALERSIDALETAVGLLRGTSASRAA